MLTRQMEPIKLPPELNVKSFRGKGDGYALIDLRYFPVSIMVWKNDASEDLMHNYYAWRKKASKVAHDHGTVHMVIKDISEWGVPKPTVRKVIGEYAAQDKEHIGFAWRFLIVSNAIMRGAITAIVWLKGEDSMYSFTKSIQASIRDAKRMYAERELEFPNGLDENTYQFPTTLDGKK